MTVLLSSNSALKAVTEDAEKFLEIIVGCKVHVYKTLNGTEEKTHLAEIISVRNKDQGVENAEFYVHYEGYNKRLDEWVKLERLDLKRLELSKDAKKLVSAPASAPKKKRGRTPNAGSEASLNYKSRRLQNVSSRTQESTEGEKNSSNRATNSSLSIGVSRVRNISTVYFGKYELNTWYFSPYPKELGEFSKIWLCEFCLEFSKSLCCFRRHREKCTLFHPPGVEIYRNENISFYEINGRNQKGYCRNLCLLSKLFLDHKTLYYDVDPFLFYTMTTNDKYGHHMIGYFSKEKRSADDFNVACILTLPQYQRLGYGKLLIAFSYELSKIEKKAGSPEKPLSDLGLLSYRSYWLDVIVNILCTTREITVNEISKRTSITTSDIQNTLLAIDVIRYYKGKMIICLTKELLNRRERLLAKNRISIDPSKIEWIPTAYQQNYG